MCCGLEKAVAGPPQNSCQGAGWERTGGMSPEGHNRCEGFNTVEVEKCVT